MTLVELLVVVSILMALILVGLPAMTPTKEARAIREAARSIDLMLGAARNQAIAAGRPMGVMLERMPEKPLAGVTIYPAEEPVPYSGEYVNSQVAVTVQRYRVPPNNDNGTSPLWTVSWAASDTGHSAIAAGMVHVYDLIQFNNQGPYYCILIGTPSPKLSDGTSDGTIVPPLTIALDCQVAEGTNYTSDSAAIRSTTGLPWNPPWNPPWSTSATPATFRIFRQPVRSGSEPLELPAGAAIDFWYSEGTGFTFRPIAQVSTKTDLLDTTPVFIMFAPNGTVAYVYQSYTRANTTTPPPPHPVLVRRQLCSTWFFFVIGKQKRIGKTGPISGPDVYWYGQSNTFVPYTNATDPDVLYVAISPLTGTSIVTENAGVAGISNDMFYNAMHGR